MNPNLKKAISVLATAAVLGVAYYGTYLPYAKSSAFIVASKAVPTAKNFDELVQITQPVLDMPSPIGQEELVRTVTSNLVDILRSLGQDKTLSAQAVGFMEKNYAPILMRNRGLNFAQHLYITGVVYEVAALQAKDSDYLAKSYEQFRRGLELSPNRPQFLLGLFDIYRFAHQTENVESVGQRILQLWPWDGRTRGALQKYRQTVEKAG